MTTAAGIYLLLFHMEYPIWMWIFLHLKQLFYG